MGTDVLRPQDCLIERIRQPPVSIYRQGYGNYCSHVKNYVPNPRSSRKPAKRPERSDKRRRVVVPSPPSPPVTSASKRSSCDDLRMGSSSGITREKVMILRRGESLDSKIMSDALTKKEGEDNIMCCPVQPIYAGSAFVVSPSPSALPLPSFSKKQPSVGGSVVVVVDSATRDLRRLLRLE